MATPNETIVTAEELQKDDTRFQELGAKKEEELSPEEQAEKKELKEKYGKRMQKRIDDLTFRTKTAEERARIAEERASKSDLLAAEIEELKKRVGPTEKPLVQDYEIIGGKRYLSDESLLKMIERGELTEGAAYKYQQERNKEKILLEAEERLETKQKNRNEQAARERDAQEVLADHPEFSNQHPNHNPEDPLYKLTQELYTESYMMRPDGLSKAVKRAKQILRMPDTAVDRGSELNLHRSSTPRDRTEKGTEVTLSEGEKETAVKMYCRGDVVNPKTGRPYTSQEAVVKALEAKKSRLTREE